MFLELTLCVTFLSLSLFLLRRATAASSKSPPTHLRQLPGPTALPIIGHLHHLLSPFLHRTFHKLATKYGPLLHLRIGSISALVITTPELAKEYLKNHDLEFAARKTNIAIQRIMNHADFTFSPYGQYWKQVNFTKEVMKFTTNILSRMMMGVRISDTEEGAKKALIVHEVGKIVGVPNLADAFPIFKFFDVQGIEKKCDDIHKRWDEMLEEILVKREKVRRKERKMGGVIDEENGVKDFLDILYDVVEDENAEMKLSRDHIKGIILDFFTGGTDTTSTSIEWTLAELINHPKIMKKAQEEIDHIVGKQRLVTESDTPNLPYIQALIKETLRLHTPFPVFHRKALQDCFVMGIKIPANTTVFINIFSMARDPKHWESPLEFNPERFLNDDSTSLRDVKGKHFELLPFGTGRRGCPGMHLALNELHTTIAAIIQCFDWKVMSNNGVVEMEEKSGLFIPMAHDLLCVPIARINNLEKIIDQ